MNFPLREDRGNGHQDLKIGVCKSYASMLAHLILVSNQ